MKKLISITTTIRNPYRLRNILKIFKAQHFDTVWNTDEQIRFFVTLIQNRLYGYSEENGFNTQFLKGLTPDQVDSFTNFEYKLSYDEAYDILVKKKYNDPAMRGRQALNPHKKLGFIIEDESKILRITDLGNQFLSDNYDLSEIFFRALIKWQLPIPNNSDYKESEGYNIKPFIGTLHLIEQVNSLEIAKGNPSKGLSVQEFYTFIPTLINYQQITIYANKIIDLRAHLKGKSKEEKSKYHTNFLKQHLSEFLDSDNEDILIKQIKNLKDYGDNILRYFRLTKFLYLRGNGYYIDLEERRRVEINELLKFDDASSRNFTNNHDFQAYFSNVDLPRLPWETNEKYLLIMQNIMRDIRDKELELKREMKPLKNLYGSDTSGMRMYIAVLRGYRRELQEIEIHRNSQLLEKMQECINSLREIRTFDNKPLALEKYTAMGLHALNDAINIKPNYPVGDDNEPITTAGGNVPDIECFYETANMICEVTMLTSRDQYYNEGQPVMRHLRDFETINTDKPAYCIFIAPSIHRDTVNTYSISVKYEYENVKQRIVPLTISDFIKILEIQYKLRTLNNRIKYKQLFELFDQIVKIGQESSSEQWLKGIPMIIDNWIKNLEK